MVTWPAAGLGSSAATGPPGQAFFRPGDVLAGRYRLVERVAGGGPAVLWRAVDDVLARPVAVKLLPAGGDAAQPFLDAAVRAGALGHPGLVRVYDAGFEQTAGGTDEVAYVISEWVDGAPLPELLADGPLEAVAATALLRQAADALSAAHARGVAHGRLHPGNVLVTESGRLRVTDAAVAASVHTPAIPGDATADDVRADTRDLAALLYALLTGRWPGAATPQPATGLPAAPAERPSSARPYSPRQVRAAVPRELDLVVSRALDPPRHPALAALATPAALADAADQAAGQNRGTQRRRSTDSPAPTRLRRSVPWLVVGAVVAAIGTGGWLLGLAVGELPRRDGAVDNVVSTGSSAPAPGAVVVPAPAPVDLSRLPVRDFDPPPGDGQESSDKVRNAVDGDPSTAWATSRYTTARFGGLKQGVGLLVDLGAAQAVGRVEVALTAPGAGLELRVADTPGGSADAFKVVAQTPAAGQVATLVPPVGTRGRYWLIWLTALPSEGNGYREGISELRFS